MRKTLFYVIYNKETNSFLNDVGTSVSLFEATKYYNLFDLKAVVNSFREINPDLMKWHFYAVPFLEQDHIEV